MRVGLEAPLDRPPIVTRLRPYKTHVRFRIGKTFPETRLARSAFPIQKLFAFPIQKLFAFPIQKLFAFPIQKLSRQKQGEGSPPVEPRLWVRVSIGRWF